MDFEKIYKIAYGEDAQLFLDENRDIGPFLAAIMCVDCIEKKYLDVYVDKEYELDALDIFYYILKKANVSLSTAIEELSTLKGNKIEEFDSFLFINLYESPFFEKFKQMVQQSPNRASRFMNIKMNVERLENSDFNLDTWFFYLLKNNINELLDLNKNCELLRKAKVSNYLNLFNLSKHDNSSVKDLVSMILGCYDEGFDEIIRQSNEKSIVNDLFTSSFTINAKKIYDGKYKETIELDTLYKLSEVIIGQEEALEKISDRLVSSLVGFNDEDRPVASFLLTGPTGVGKTETAKQIAKLYSSGKMFTLDMTTFKHSVDIARLTGSSAGYIGYNDKNQFVDFLNNNPKCVLLFDEIDKCHPDCLDVFMRMLDEGKFIDAKNVEHSLSKTIIFCTTNATEHSQKISRPIGFETERKESVESKLTSKGEMKKEFIGRYDEVIEYRKLSFEECKVIAKNMLDSKISIFENNRKDDKIKLKYSSDLLDKIVKDAEFDLLGARSLKTSIQHNFVNRVAKFLVENKISNQTLVVSSDKVQTSIKR